ncbi:craniofacial development protein 2 [Elysia marginata]|uniref:Craniofacial development protein 2 n=1 Tax=Elysia marginata TaxID=1093978 RepID=A0AAV4H515_9GAST|nr:craniofacial development protein 2 [Elysia marginata]
MTRLGESREEAQELTTPIVNPKSILNLGNWNVRTMYATGKAAQVAKEMSRYSMDILGVRIDIKTEFYETLDETVRKSHRHDILIVTGDFNAKVGTDPNHYDSVMGKHGEGERNENSERLFEFCAMNDLIITGTLFPHKKIHKLTWVSPDGKTKNQIDHTLINKKFKTSVRDTRVQRGADVSSDHYLVKTSL